MTQKTKLEIISEYRKDHPGPFCTRDGRAARIICVNRKSKSTPEFPVVALVDDGDQEINLAFEKDGKDCTGATNFDLMCAREVPVPREFWLVEFRREIDRFCVTDTEQAARCILGNSDGALRIVRTLEVLPGEGA